VQEAKSTSRKKRFKTSGKEVIITNNRLSISYRVIDIATTQIKFSDEVSFNGGGKRLVDVANDLGGIASKRILNAIFPIRVINVNGNHLTLAQGGGMFNAGSLMQLVTLGKPLVDPYTKESLGREERVIGEIKITNVESKTSSAVISKLFSGKIADYMNVPMIIRPYKRALKANRRPVSSVKKSSKKIKQKFKKLKEESNDDW